jgi:hypothetical protein
MSGAAKTFPPQPDVAPAPDYAPITFVPQGGGVVARLGVIDVGSIRPNHGGARVGYYWSSHLPGGPSLGKPSTSIEAAMQRLAEHVHDWFAACGIQLPKGEV